ncbi:hypothetical protein GCM10010398_01950 [Streptomyces fimbriatus]
MVGVPLFVTDDASRMSGEERPRETPKAAPRAAFAKSVRTRSQWAAGEAVHHQVRVECANMPRP